ncbi:MULTISPECIES: methyl-accepting chemotaxis protein [Ferrimonas]|uniref:methyl-accepting chemotaxis protein n=1 Tax=Ferrimonas TaxID=44011 RepID=UPI0003FE5B2B|nr:MULTISPECIES: methyl-accepting chemotaxis protein [Ferrimonas]USD37138.1 cache domain-containing protein [Ferrimonas sp. SCSIO 43195]
MGRLGLMGKMLLLASVPLVMTMVVVTASSVYFKSQTLEQQVATFTKDLRQEKIKQVQDAVTIAISTVRNQIAAHPGEAPLAVVKDALAGIEFGDGGYFFVYNMEGTVQFHGLKPQTVGQNQLHLTDPNGTPFIANLVAAAKRGGDTASYFYQKPGATGLVEKISYVKPLTEYGWFLGTGVYVDEIEAAVALFRSEAQAMAEEETLINTLVSLGIMVLAVVAIVAVSRKTVEPVNQMLANLREIAQGEGDLTKRLQVKGDDEIAQLGLAFNQFTSKLQDTIREVAEATVQVGQAVDNINQQTGTITRQLSVHNDETEQVVTAVTEMSTAAAEIAGNANQVAEATQAAADDADTAQDKLGHSVSAINTLVGEVDLAAQHIDRLNAQSTRIHSVLGVIGDIAEQTNLLALNAAIEAARAGDQGRGFAVVADEVRGLASRTQTSTLEIKEMLDELHQSVAKAVSTMDNSQSNCETTVSASGEITTSLTAVSGAVNEINDMTSQIATAATEQSSVTEEINRNMVSIRDIVTELVYASDESAQISEQLGASGRKLSQLVGQFKV